MEKINEEAGTQTAITDTVSKEVKLAKVLPLRRLPLIGTQDDDDIDEVFTKEERPLRIGCQVEEVDGLYVRYTKKGEKEAISNFTLKIVEKIQGKSSVTYVIDIRGQGGAIVRKNFSNLELCRVAKFKERLSQFGLPLSYQGNQKNLDDIFLRIACDEYLSKESVDYIGIMWPDSIPVFASQDRCVYADGKECTEIVVNNNAVDVETDLLRYNPITAEELNDIVAPLFGFNSLPITTTVIGYAASCFLRPILKTVGIKHGSLLLIGESGSGKSTTLDEVVRPIFGCGTPVSAADLTEASLRFGIGSSNSIPFVIEEYKQAKLNKENINSICNALRNNYDQTMARKCSTSNSIIEKPLRAPIILVGESQPSETAIRERCLQVLFSKAALEENLEYNESLTILRQRPSLLHKLGRSLLQAALRMDPEKLRDIHEEWMSLLAERQGDLPVRVRNSVVNGMLGLKLFQSVCTTADQTLEVLVGKTEDEFLTAICFAVTEYLLQGETHNRSVVEEALAIMFGDMQLQDGVDYQFINDNTQVALDLNGVYARFISFVKSQGLQSDVETLPKKQFLQQLKQTKYFVSIGTTRFCRTRPKQSVKLNAVLLRERIGETLLLAEQP